MIKSLKIFSIFLLLFNGVGAFYGSWHLITDPSGASLQLPIEHLRHSPFKDFFVPGIILLCVYGILSFVVIALILLKSKIYSIAVIIEGCILFGWITIQVIMIRSIGVLHIVFWITAVLLMISGFILHKKTHTVQV